MKYSITSKTGKIILSGLIAFVLLWFVQEPEFNRSQTYVLFLLFFSIALWLSEAIPAYVVSILIMAYLVFTLGNDYLNPEPRDVLPYVNTFSSTGIWLIMGGFFIASAMTKTTLDKDIFQWALRISGNSPVKILFSILILTMVLSMLMSNTATTAMLIAAVGPLLLHLGKENGLAKALVVGIPVASTIGGMATIIGSPPNSIASSLLTKQNITMSFVDWMVFGVPIMLLFLVLNAGTLYYFFLRGVPAIDLNGMGGSQAEEVPRSHKTMVIVIVVLTVLFWLTTSIHHVSVAAISAFPILLLPLSGVLVAKDIKQLPWDTLFLVAGGLSLGLALEETNLLRYYSDKLLLLPISPISMLLIFCYVSMLVSNIMSNTAASSLMIPLVMTVLPGMEKEVAAIIAIASSTSLLLPVSSPSNAIAYSTGVLKQKDFLYTGAVMAVIGPLLAFAVVLLLK